MSWAPGHTSPKSLMNNIHEMFALGAAPAVVLRLLAGKVPSRRPAPHLIPLGLGGSND